MNILKILIFTFLLTHCHFASAQRLLIAAASDMKFAMQELVSEFEKKYPKNKVIVSFGSSGKFKTQIMHGAPYDMYFSADIAYPKLLESQGYSASAVTPYAKGRLVLLSLKRDISHVKLTSLTGQVFNRIAIANPKHAPYGIRAKEALSHFGLWEQIRKKVIFGDSVSHTAQFIVNQHVDAGIVALSLIPGIPSHTPVYYQLLPETTHSPLTQGFIVTKQGADNQAAWEFSDFMQSKTAASTLTQYGFEIPSVE